MKFFVKIQRGPIILGVGVGLLRPLYEWSSTAPSMDDQFEDTKRLVCDLPPLYPLTKRWKQQELVIFLPFVTIAFGLKRK